MNITYAIWWGDTIVAQVRLPADASDQRARSRALELHEKVPMCARPEEDPHTRAHRILFGRVKRYRDGQ